MVAAFQAGANVYFDSEEARDAFIKALELVMLGETILPPELLSYVRDTQEEAPPKPQQHAARIAAEVPQVTEGDWPQLSFRESCILRCIVEGASNKVIARQIDIAEATVKVHVKAILRKVRVRNRTQAAIWAMSHASHIWHADNGHHPPKELVPLPLAPRQVSLQRLAVRNTADVARNVTIADVSSLVGRGLNGNGSLIARRGMRRRGRVPEKEVEAGSARAARRPDASA
jgi:two-component system nitrate/nitrite response regulator NarL